MHRAASLLPVTLLAACASRPCPCPAPPDVGRDAPSAAPAPARIVPAAGTILDHRDGTAVSFDALVERLAGASVVYVGVQHDQAAHHAFPARVLDALLARRRGRPVAPGV